jgi:hypothetical protein
MPGAVITDFSLGELSERFKGRFDLEAYGRGALEVTNFIPTYPGGVTMRPGVKHIGQIGIAKVRLVPFIISDSLAYILEFCSKTIRIWKDGSLLTSAGVPLSIATPYSDIFNLQFAQDAAKLFIVSGSDKIKVLEMTVIDTFTFSDLAITSNEGMLPFQSTGNYPKAIAIHDGRLYLAGTSAEPQTIWASQPFDYGNFTYFDTVEYTSSQLREPQNAFSGYIRSGSTRILEVSADEIAKMKIGDRITGQGIQYEYGKTYTYITALGSDYIDISLAATATGTYTLYDGWHDPTIPEYTDVTNSRDVVTSASAFKKTIAADSNEMILWLASMGNLVVGTTCSERIIPSGTNATNFVCKKMTAYGSKRIQPILLNDAIVFLSPDGNTAREYSLQPSSSAEAYYAPMLTINADHILSNVAQIDYSSSGWSIMWLLNSTGECIGIVRDRVIGIASFFRIRLADGVIESIAVIPESGTDQLYMSINRNGTRYLVKLGDAVNCLDEYAEKTVVGGMITDIPWISGSATLIYNNQKYSITVSNGSVEVPEDIPNNSIVLVGLPYTARIRTMPTADNPMRQKQVPKVTMKVLNSYEFKVGYQNKLQASKITGKYSGDIDLMIGGSWDTEGSLTIEQDSLPLTILAIRLDINQGG